MTSDTDSQKFGFWTLTFMVIANMVGAGVFATSGFAIYDLRSPHLVVAAWVVGGIIALSGAISYGQLVRAMPESGGEYLFLSRAAHPLLGFVAGWVSLIAGFSGAIALAAAAFESYALPESARPAWLPANSVAVLLILGAGLCHAISIRAGQIVQNVVVILKLGLIVALLMLAAGQYGQHTWHVEELEGGGDSGPVGAFFISLVWISLSYLGFNAAVYVAGEASDAARTVPRALIVGTIIVIGLYVPLNAILVYATPASDIARKKEVALIVAQALGGDRAGIFVTVIISGALLTSVISMMMAAPRVFSKMAEDGFLPSFMQFRGNAPFAAVAVQVVVATVLVLIYGLRGLIPYLGLTLSVSAACSVACLFLPTVRRHRVLHVSHLAPAIYIACTLAATGVMAVLRPAQIAGAGITFVLGAVAYLLVKRAGRSQ